MKPKDFREFGGVAIDVNSILAVAFPMLTTGIFKDCNCFLGRFCGGIHDFERLSEGFAVCGILSAGIASEFVSGFKEF